MLSFKGVAELTNKEWFEQLPFIVAVSVVAGVMGALFNIAHKRMFRVRCSPCCFKQLTASLLQGTLQLPVCHLKCQI